MDNFFYNESDFELFKKALKISQNEPVVINVMQDDESLKEETTASSSFEELKMPIKRNERNRYAFSNRSDSSPFSKYFSPRKTSRKPIDISNFSNWRNKNYRNIEKSIDDNESENDDFSISDYFTEKSRGRMYNHGDQVTNDMQKPLNELSTEDEKYKRFSLDSYLQKLERQTAVEGEFERSGDLLEPLGNIDQDKQEGSFNQQDDNFEDHTKFDFDEVINDNEEFGERYAIDQSKLDMVRDSIDKRREEDADLDIQVGNNGNLNKEEDILYDDLNFINFDDEEEENNDNYIDDNSKDVEKSTEADAEIDEQAVVSDTERTSKTMGSDNRDVTHSEDETETLLVDQGVTQKVPNTETNIPARDEQGTNQTFVYVEPITQQSNQTNQNIDEVNFITDRTQQTETDEDKSQQDDLNQEQETNEMSFVQTETPIYEAPESIDEEQDEESVDDKNQDKEVNEAQASESQELNEKLVDIIEEKTKANLEMVKQLKNSEDEKNIQKEQYEEQIKNLEDNIKKQKEEAEEHAYLDKLKFDENIKSIEESNRQREAEIREEEKRSQKLIQIGENLSKEIKSNLESSNLEMDKKFYETALQTKTKKVRKSTSGRVGNKKSRKTRKLDSDIIGSIDIE